MKNEGVVLATGQWYSKTDCPDYIQKSKFVRKNSHFFADFQRKKSKNKGEYLISSRCQNCGGLIIDCPTIGAF